MSRPENYECNSCMGTGIGKHGPVDKSRCGICGGRGSLNVTDEMDYENYMEMKMDLMREDKDRQAR